MTIETGPEPCKTVIWLHGLGADGHDFEPIVAELGVARSVAIRFVFPHAPIRPVTINGGIAMRAWYDIKGLDLDRDEDRSGIAGSVGQVDALIRHEQARGVSARDIVLAGFSQGGVVALRCGLSRSQALAGVIALSCYLPEAAQLDQWLTPAGRMTPVFMGHGTLDPVVPVVLGREAARRLAEAGVPLSWGEWPIQHGVCAEEIAAIDRWLRERFSGVGR